MRIIKNEGQKKSLPWLEIANGSRLLLLTLVILDEAKGSDVEVVLLLLIFVLILLKGSLVELFEAKGSMGALFPESHCIN